MSFADELRKTDPNTKLIENANHLISSFRDKCKAVASAGGRSYDNKKDISCYSREDYIGKILSYHGAINSHSDALFTEDYIKKTLRADGFTTLYTEILKGYNRDPYPRFGLYGINIYATW